MSERIVNWLLTIEPFSKLNPERFRGKVTLRGILENDTRVVRCEKGDIIVRQGDWGNSAFFVVSGSVRADLGSDRLPGEILGRTKPRRKNLLQILSQLWTNPREPEVRDVAAYRDDPNIARRGTDENARVYLQDVSAVLDQYRTAEIRQGQFFGELSALGRTQRQATVFADQDSTLLEIRWQGLRDLMRRDDGIRAHIDSVFRERGLHWFLLNTPIFKHLEGEELEQLVEQAEFETHGQYDWAGGFKQLAKHGIDTNLQHEPLIAEEGNYPNGVVILRSGLARLSQRREHGHVTLGYVTPGQIFGMDEIVDGWLSGVPTPLHYSLRAIGMATVVVIPTRLIETLLLETAGRRTVARQTQRAGNPLASGPTIDRHRIDADFVEFLVQNRFVNGTATMLIDMDRCTRCDDCVRACATTHENNPRFLRTGPIQNNIMVAHACMHCEDPVCMIECPTGAIHRNLAEGQVMINDQTCIGCSACANNCPYEAIRMVDVRHSSGDFIRDDQRHAPIVKATKCDLCAAQWSGPACQRACPHDALVRMDMRDIHSLANWYDRT